MTSVLDKLLAKTGKTRAEIGLPEVHEIPPVPPPVPRAALPANASVLDKMLHRAGKTYEQAVAEISPFLADESRFTLALRAPEQETERLAQVRDVDLSDDQKRAYDAIFAWLNKNQMVPGQQNSNLLTLSGFAGTGKTTVVSLVAQNYRRSVAFAAPTGKAAGVLRKKLKDAGIAPKFCGTIHSLMYTPVENIETGEVGWAKKSFLGYRDEDDEPVHFGLLIIDEASMLQDRVLEDLQAYGIRILAIGDHGQLPPVMGSGSLMRNPHLKLEKIHRQAESNPIIRLSACIRETGKLLRSAEDGDKIRFVEQKNMAAEIDRLYRGATEEQLLDRVVLSYSNANRCRFNTDARLAYFGKHEALPRDGELCICLRNANVAFDKGEARIYNGLRGFMRGAPDARFPHKYLSVFDFSEFSDLGMANLEISRYQFGKANTFANFQELAQFKHEPKTWWEVGGLFDYGYALTVHKCVDPTTLVETPNGLVRAGDLASAGEVATPTGRAAYRNVVSNPVGPMLNIKTRDGYSLRVTPDHGVDVWSPDEGYVRTEAHLVKAGDTLRLRLGAEFDGIDSVLPVGRPQDVRAKIHKLPTTCGEDEAEFFGLMVADGTLYKKGFRLAKRHEDVANRFDELCRKLFGVEPKRFFTLGAYHVEVPSVFLAAWLRDVGGMNPKAKAVPACVLSSRLHVQARFLRGVFEDGTVNLNGDVLDHVEFTAVYEELRRAVRTMLLRFGIVAGETLSHPASMYLYGQYARKFGDEIGFVSRFKQERLLQAPVPEGTKYTLPLRRDETDCNKRRKLAVQRHRADARMADRVPFHHSDVASVTSYLGPSVCVEVPEGHQFLQDGFCGWNSQGSGWSDVLVYYDRPGNLSAEDCRRLYYTAVTRASERLTVVY